MIGKKERSGCLPQQGGGGRGGRTGKKRLSLSLIYLTGADDESRKDGFYDSQCAIRCSYCQRSPYTYDCRDHRFLCKCVSEIRTTET